MGFNVLYSNTLTGANANPFDSVNWTPLNNSNFALQVLGGVGVAQNGFGAAEEYYSGSALSGINDQWISFAVAEGTSGSAYVASVRSGTSGPNIGVGYEVQIVLGTGGFGVAGSIFILDVALGQGIGGGATPVINQGDVFLLTAVGGIVVLYQNGTPIIGAASTSTPTGGTVWIQVNYKNTNTDTAITNLQFGSVTAYSISGVVTSGSSPFAGVTVRAFLNQTQAEESTVTASDGTYSFPDIPNGLYTVQPETGFPPHFIPVYTSSPTSLNETINNANITGIDFNLTTTISGNAGIAGATVSYSGTASGSVTADGSGNYTISGLANGSYTVTPSLSGNEFSPTNRFETITDGAISGVNFTAVNPPTNGVIIQGQFVNQSNISNAIMGAFPQNANRYQLDLIQVIATGGQVVWKLDYTGTITVNPTSWTKGTLLGQFQGASFSACFQQNNTNPYHLDILQIRDQGGSVVWWLDWTGTVNSLS
jgi:hypothetical protein